MLRLKVQAWSRWLEVSCMHLACRCCAVIVDVNLHVNFAAQGLRFRRSGSWFCVKRFSVERLVERLVTLGKSRDKLAHLGSA